MEAKHYGALLLDLDGTLLTEEGTIRPRTREALVALEASGVPVMITTGRSAISAAPIVEDLGLSTVAVVFNGAAVWCPREQRLIEERVVSPRTFERALRFTREFDYQWVVMCAGRKFARPPRDEDEAHTLSGLHGLELVPLAELEAPNPIRMTWFSRVHEDSASFAREVEEYIDLPIYLTDFPLNALASHRASMAQVVDMHPPCKGKAEALRVLREHYDVPADSVVAVGDATNDLPMLSAAGLGAVVENGMREAVEAADRVIGSNDSDAIAELVEELFVL